MVTLCFSTFAEVKVLENNNEFSSLIDDIAMPTVLIDSINLHGFSKYKHCHNLKTTIEDIPAIFIYISGLNTAASADTRPTYQWRAKIALPVSTRSKMRPREPA